MFGHQTWSKTFTITPNGGYGEYQYAIQVFKSTSDSTPIANLTRDFSVDNKYGLSWKGAEAYISGYVLKIQIKDSLGTVIEFQYIIN